MALLALAGCRQLLGIEEASVDKDAPAADDAAPADGESDAPPCVDSDGDGVCNDVDTWPCGVEPADLPAMPVYDEAMGNDHITIQLTNPTLEDVRKLVVAPGASVRFKTQYTITDCVCAACLDQIEIGFSPGDKEGCIYNGNPAGNSIADCMNPTSGNAQLSLTAPAQPGAYTLRFRVGQDFVCTPQRWWEDTPPPASASAVHLCVTGM